MCPAHCKLHTTQYTLHIVSCTLHNTHCTLHTKHCTLQNRDYTLHISHCKEYTTHCTKQTIHSTLHIKLKPIHIAHFTLIHFKMYHAPYRLCSGRWNVCAKHIFASPLFRQFLLSSKYRELITSTERSL